MKSPGNKSNLTNAIKITLGLLLLYLAFQRVDWQLLLQSLQSVRIFWLSLAILSVLLSLSLKVLRWDLLLRNYQVHLPPKRLISAYFLGQAANILLIIRGGEIVRVTTAHLPGKDDWVEITATIALEKYLDLLLLVLLMVFTATNLPSLALEKMGSLSPILLVLTLMLLLLVTLGPILWHRLMPQQSSRPWIAKVQLKLDQIVQASLWLRDPRKLLPALAITLLTWVVMASTNWLVFQSLALDLSWDAAILVLILVYLGVLPALMPGNVGPFTYFAQLALIPFAVGNDLALAFAVILYFIVTVPPLLIAGLTMLLPLKLNRKAAP
ncbi:MAG: lysylphosphatidylglycerol synthase transmembrane domain-containing protein [Anaerolineaceae bacterium]|nr:lysylphosphatidylglycerol synthase transmembrane domain-containing protein [Anaerolineaceae bacterium]